MGFSVNWAYAAGVSLFFGYVLLVVLWLGPKGLRRTDSRWEYRVVVMGYIFVTLGALLPLWHLLILRGGEPFFSWMHATVGLGLGAATGWIFQGIRTRRWETQLREKGFVEAEVRKKRFWLVCGAVGFALGILPLTQIGEPAITGLLAQAPFCAAGFFFLTGIHMWRWGKRMERQFSRPIVIARRAV